MLDIQALQYAGVPILLLNIAIVEGLKRLGVKTKISGLIAIVIGLAEGLILFSEGDIATGVIIGLAIGLSSVGLFSTGKNVGESAKENDSFLK